MREKMHQEVIILRKLMKGHVLKGMINVENRFEIQYGINPRRYLETLVIGIL